MERRYSWLLGTAIVIWGHFLSNPAFTSEFEPGGPREMIERPGFNLQLVSGALFSAHIFSNGTPVTNVWQTDLRLGWALNEPGMEESFIRGNFEAILALTYASIYRGPGSYYAGLAGLLRYNFLQPGSKWAPYVQIGAGIVHNDAYKDESQSAIGNSIEFTPQASVGFRYLFREKWSIDFEGIFLHISNANLAERNTGLNSFGGFVGITHYFDRPRK